MKKRIQKWLEINQDQDQLSAEDVKDKVLFELSFIDRMSLKEKDNSKLFSCHIIFFLLKESDRPIAHYKQFFYRANSKNEAYGAFIKELENKEITPEVVSSDWRPIVQEIDPDCFIDVREED